MDGLKRMGYKTRVKGSAAQIGNVYKESERQPNRLPRRAGQTPNNRVAGVRERSLVDPVKVAREYQGKDIRKLPTEESNAVYHARKEAAHTIRTTATDDYVAGRITEAAWRKKLNEADRLAAPSKAEVLTQMELRENAQKPEGSPQGGYNGWTNWDTWETVLIMENTESTQRNMDAWNKNFNRKIKAGKFNPEQAEMAVGKYIVPVARGSKKWHDRGLVTDPEIDPKKVNKAEIVKHIIEYDE